MSNKIAVGGTFDHLHLGHQALLQLAASQGDELLIGLTTDRFAHAKDYPNSLESYQLRYTELTKFCEAQGWHFQIVPLEDAVGPTLSDQTISGLAVTRETEAGGRAINQRRRQIGLPALPLFVAKMVLDSHGQEIHSERIRAGEIDRTGQWYVDAISLNQPLTQKQRAALSPPLGDIVTVPRAGAYKTCVVGDQSLAEFIRHDWLYDLGVFDNQTGRAPTPDQRWPVTLQATNPAGQISSDLLAKLATGLEALPTHSPQLIQVNGEEDLATAALILMLPLASIMYYGQPKQGLVEVEVTEAKKHQLAQIFRSA